MENFSEDELAFVRNGVSNGLRIDLRKAKDERSTQIICSDIAQSDGSVRVARGWSEVEVSLQFKETTETLIALGITRRGDDSGDESPIDAKVEIPVAIKSMILGFLAPHRLGIRIDLNVISNDGNVYDLFFAGLNALLGDLEIPVVNDLERTERRGLDIPLSRTAALFGNGGFVLDPTRIEEKASCGLMHVFVDTKGMLMGCLPEGQWNTTEETLAATIQEMTS